MLELATIANAKREVTNRTRCTKLQSPRTLPGVEIRHRKNGGTPVSVSATKGNRSPTVKSYNKVVQCCNNRSLKAEEIMAQYPELEFQLSHEDNKENEISFVDHQIEGLVKQVNSIDLNKRTVVHCNGLN